MPLRVFGIPQRPAVPVIAPIAFFIVAGGLHTGVFFRHAWDHEFWMQALQGGLYLGAAHATGCLFKSFRPPLRVTAIGLVLGAVIWGSIATWQRQDEQVTDRFEKLGERVNAQTDPQDLIITPAIWGQEVYYIEGHTIPRVGNMAFMNHLIQRYQELGLNARVRFLIPRHRWEDPGVLEITAFLEGLPDDVCPAPVTFDEFRMYTFTPR